MDLSNLKPNERTLDIVHPGTGAPIGVSVNVMGMDDERMKKIRRAITDRKLELDLRGKRFQAQELENNRNTLVFNAMTGWEWGMSPNGEPVTFKGQTPQFNSANVFAVFEELPWFRDQIEEFIAEQKNFFQN
jgi:hypothetical protein